ncbi:MAG: NosD domain-containing protein [Gemmataceae bacterium]
MRSSVRIARSRRVVRGSTTQVRLQCLEDRVTPSRTLTVDDDRMQLRSAQYTTIQAAVNAAQAGDRILVYAGTYRESVVIPDAKDRISLSATGRGVAKITTPTGALADATKSLVHVDGADDVTIRGFTVAGPGTGTADSLRYGILVDGGGSADILDNRVLSIRDSRLSGTQQGVGIQFGRLATGESGSGSAVGNTVEDYQKGGIVVIGDGSRAEIVGNTVKGVGGTNVNAQNGIQVSDGAHGAVVGNTVSGNKFTGANVAGIGILVYNTRKVAVTGNFTSGNDYGIELDTAASIYVGGNKAFNNVLNGIDLFGSNDSEVVGNVSTGNGQDGIGLEDATGNSVSLNLALGNHRDGIHLDATATDNRITVNAALSNEGTDIVDLSTGTGTGGTANTWRANKFNSKNPAGIR